MTLFTCDTVQHHISQCFKTGGGECGFEPAKTRVDISYFRLLCGSCPQREGGVGGGSDAAEQQEMQYRGPNIDK